MLLHFFAVLASLREMYFAREGSKLRFLLVVALTGFALADSFAAIPTHNALLGKKWTLRRAGAAEFTLADEDQTHGHQHKKQSEDNNGE